VSVVSGDKRGDLWSIMGVLGKPAHPGAMDVRLAGAHLGARLVKLSSSRAVFLTNLQWLLQPRRGTWLFASSW
jgi:hypothetical protein